MKKGVVFVVFLFAFFLVGARNTKIDMPFITKEKSVNSVVTFVEKGIRFRVYLNGRFNFDPKNIRKKKNTKVAVEKDYQGRVNKVGDVFIDYNLKGNVHQVGSVNLKYNTKRFLTRVGNLTIEYNRWGSPTFYGRVRYNDYYYNNYDTFYNGVAYQYYNPFFYTKNFKNHYRQYKEDNSFYYYKAISNNRCIRKGNVIKRRKNQERIY